MEICVVNIHLYSLPALKGFVVQYSKKCQQSQMTEKVMKMQNLWNTRTSGLSEHRVIFCGWGVIQVTQSKGQFISATWRPIKLKSSQNNCMSWKCHGFQKPQISWYILQYNNKMKFSNFPTLENVFRKLVFVDRNTVSVWSEKDTNKNILY